MRAGSGSNKRAFGSGSSSYRFNALRRDAGRAGVTLGRDTKSPPTSSLTGPLHHVQLPAGVRGSGGGGGVEEGSGGGGG